MQNKAGLWIDHTKAVIVTITPKGEELSVTLSMAHKQLRRAGDSPLKGRYEPLQVPPEDRRHRSYVRALDIYYDAVIAHLDTAQAILIFGPAEAKSELKKRLKKRNMADRIVAVETADKMTDRQIAAKVRQHFGK
jgi:hypothetical protein